jgi:hypothetical protein
MYACSLGTLWGEHPSEQVGSIVSKYFGGISRIWLLNFSVYVSALFQTCVLYFAYSKLC